jgi:parvulin-like peptidyl-prolyl isomerase
MRKRFAAKAEARFLERKNELDQVVYSLLRLKNSFLARELYLQIESGESNFADLAKRYAEGPERNTNGIVGPVSLTQAHPVLVEKLRVAQPGVLLEPFRISDWWLVVRLERYSPASFTDEVSDQMCQEMFDLWVDEETAASLNQLAPETSAPEATSAFTDFSVSR